MQTFSRKNKLLIGLILLVILGSVGLLSSQILNRIALSRPSTAVRPATSPAVANGIVYIGSYDGKLYAFDARTGGTLWSYRTGDVILSSPTVADGVVYIGSDDGKLYAFHLPPGTT